MHPIIPQNNTLIEQIEQLLLQDELEDATHHCQKLLNSQTLTPHEAIKVNNLMGAILLEQKQTAEALVYFKFALDLSIQYNEQDKELLADVHQNLAYCYTISNQTEQAIPHFKQAITCFGQIHKPQTLAKVHINLGYAYNQQENFTQALANYEAALQIYLQLDAQNELASLYNNIGWLYNKTGDHDKELFNYQKAESLIVHTQPQPVALLATIYNNIGLCYTKASKYDMSLQYLQKSLQLRQQQYGENHVLLANLYNNMGLCFLRQMKYAEANQYFDKTIAIRNALNEQNHPFYANTLSNMGMCFLYQKQVKAALGCLQQSLDIRLGLFAPHHSDIATNYLHIAQCYFEQKEYQNTLSFCDQALRVLSGSQSNSLQAIDLFNSPEPVRLLQTLELKSKVLYQQYLLDRHLATLNAAFEHAQTATLLIDELRRGYRLDGAKLVLAQNGISTLQQTVSICIELYEHTQQLDYWYQAFNFAEKSKSVLLLNAIKDAEAKLIANIDPSLIEKEKSIRQRLSGLDEKMLQERALPTPDTQRLNQWQAQHFDLYGAYEQLLQHLETTNPNYHYLKYSIGTTSVADLQVWLATQTQTALISYMVTANCLFVFVVTAAHFEAMRLPLPSNFKIQIEEFMDSINCHNQDDYVEIGYELYQILLQKPLQIITQHLPNAQHLVIIPDNELCYLPFEALLSSPQDWDTPYNELPYVLQQYDISYHYSATLLYETICQKRRSLLSDTFGGFAPVYTAKTNSNNKSAVSVNRSGIQYSELIFSEVELTNIAALFGQHQVTAQLFLHQDASEENFKKHSAQYKYLHIAAHGVLNKKHPELSGILLAPQDDANSTEDGMLYIAETYHLELRADLVVLSCCESGIGQMIRGEGMMAINRGFLYAGAKNIIYTLFKVYDEESARLTENLFREILTHHEPYNRALSQAKRQLIQQVHTTPKAWSGFVLLGV